MPLTQLEPAISAAPEAACHSDLPALVSRAIERHELKLVAFARPNYPGKRLPHNMLPGLLSIGCWDASSDQTWGSGSTRIEGLVLSFVGRGRIDLSLDDQNFALGSGRLAIVRPWQRHALGRPCVTASRYHWVVLDLGVRQPNNAWLWPPWLILSQEERDRLALLLHRNEQPVLQANQAVRDCFERIAGWIPRLTASQAESRLSISVSTLLIELLWLLESKQAPSATDPSSKRRLVEAFLASLPAHLAQPWTVETMASHCGLARSSFTYHCGQITNLSPLQHLMSCRLQAAARLLRKDPKRPITDVALGCGFDSSQYFSHAFHQHFGCAPSKYRLRPESGGPGRQAR